MSDDQPVSKQDELKERLLTEYRARPWLAYCGMACWLLFLAGVVLNGVVRGQEHLATKYYTITLVHLLGLLAGVIGIAAAPRSIKGQQKKTLVWPTIFNGLFLLLFGYRSLVLMLIQMQPR